MAPQPSDREGSYLVEPNRSPNPAPPVLSIVIVHYKTAELTLGCVESIYEFPPTGEFEVIVLDNASDDGIEAMLAERFPKVRFVETGSNLGYAKANNLGIQNSHGRHILLLNSDARLVGPLFDAMLDYVERHPKAGFIGPRHVDAQDRFQLSSGHFPTFLSELVRKLMHYRLSIDDFRLRDYLADVHSVSGSVDWISGSCLLMRRDALHDTGLLDERFFMYFEDIDLCTRARKSGWEVHYCSSAKVMHYGGESAKKNLLTAMIAHRQSQLYFSRKYYGAFGEIVIRALLLAKYGANVLRWGSAHLFFKFFPKQNLRAIPAYQMALLSKKVLEFALQPVPAEPQTPALLGQNIHKSSSI